MCNAMFRAIRFVAMMCIIVPVAIICGPIVAVIEAKDCKSYKKELFAFWSFVAKDMLG